MDSEGDPLYNRGSISRETDSRSDGVCRWPSEEKEHRNGSRIRLSAFINRELSWLRFARRVLEMATDPTVPLLERVKFAGILGMLHDEFFMKRVSGLKRQVNKGVNKLSLDGLTPD